MPDYEKIRKYRNSINRFAQYVGIETVEMSDGYAKAVLTVKPEFENTIGSLHGGAIFSLADTVTGSAAASCGIMHTTVNCSMNYLKPVLHEKKLIGTAHRVKKGKTISVYDVEITNDEGAVFATGSFTYFNLNKPVLPPELQ